MKDLCSDREGRLKFLIEAGKILQSKCPSVATYLNTYGSQLARNFNSSMPACWIKKNLVCLYCLTAWNRDNYTISLRPTIKPSKKIKYIIQKQNKNKSCSNIENKLAAIVHSGNHIVLKCLMCSKTTLFLLNKRHLPTLTTAVQKQTKKKKKKDYLAGLSPAVREVVQELHKKNDKKTKQVSQGEVTKYNINVIGGCDDIVADEDGSILKIDSEGDSLCKFRNHIDMDRRPCSSEKKKAESRLQIVAPLGTKPTGIDISAKAKAKAKAFIPLDSKIKHKSNFEVNDFQKSSSSSYQLKKKPTKFINPYALTDQGKSNKKQKKRIDHLQQIIAEEKNKSKGRSTCFKDFLTLI